MHYVCGYLFLLFKQDDREFCQINPSQTLMNLQYLPTLIMFIFAWFKTMLACHIISNMLRLICIVFNMWTASASSHCEIITVYCNYHNTSISSSLFVRNSVPPGIPVIAEFWLEHGGGELSNLAWKIMEKPTFHSTGEFFYFLSAEFPFLSTEFPFSERRILGGLLRAPLQFLSAKFAFSECRISIFSTEFAVSEHRILGSLFRAVLGCKICFFWVQNFEF